jgi:hypothetical protein
MIQMLEAAAFQNQSIDEQAAKQLIAEANALLGSLN